MQYKRIGNFTLPAIGQGTQGIKDVGIIQRGISLGMTFIDTAEVYGNEEIIGQAIKGIRDKVFISTKFSPENNGCGDVLAACHNSLRKLGTDYIDLYSMHWPNPAVPIEQTRDALIELQKQGKIRHIGVCNASPLGLGNLEPEAIQVEYNLFDRTIESGLLPYCEQNNILTVAYSPLQYLYKLNPDPMCNCLAEIAFEHQKSLAQVVLNWLISHKTVIAIPKSKNYKHQAANAAASDFALSQAELAQIDSLFECKVAYIPPHMIKISKVGKFPQTIEEAKANICNFHPSPVDLSQGIADIKPVRVEHRKGKFELVEGGLRFWAWVIRYGDKPVPALIIGEADEVYKPTPEIQCEKHPGAKHFMVNKQKYCSTCYEDLLNRTIGALKD